MGWVALVHHTSYEEAQRIADPHDLACVSCRMFERQIGEWNVRPIVTRIKIRKYWYNYFEDGTYHKSRIVHENGTVPESYAPYYWVPDKVRYLDLQSYLYQHLWKFKGVFCPYILYYTKTREEVIYSVFLGVLHTPLNVSFDNPLLYFERGMPIVKRNHDYRRHMDRPED